MADERLPTNLSALPDHEFGFEQARHLLLRAGFGGTPAQIEAIAALGAERAVDYLVDVEDVSFAAPSADAFDRDILRPYTQAEQAAINEARRRRDENTLAEVRARRQQAQREDRRQMRRVQLWWLERMIETPRPLEEKLTLFWHGHFATSYRTIENSYHMYQQNQLFRRHALGNFGELLFWIIRDPAMLAYLDNNDSRVGQPNENLARELMELFSLGVGNYTERDIKEGARALTGYTFRDDEFVFVENNHDRGRKSILGVAGDLDGDGFVTAILRQPACSRFIARKLYSFFVGQVPERFEDIEPDRRRFIENLAARLLRDRYDLKPTLRRLLLSRHFYHEANVGEKIKSPADLIVGSVRSLRTPVRDLSVLLDAMNLMGQDIMYPPSVKGWDGGRSWINTSTLFVRQNIMNFLLTGKLPVGYDALATTERYDPSPLLEPLAQADPSAARDPERVTEYLLRFTLGRSPVDARRIISDFVESRGGRLTPDMVTGMLLLVTALPEYQLC